MHMEPMLEIYNENSTIQATSQSIGNSLPQEHRARRTQSEWSTLCALLSMDVPGGRNSLGPILSVVSPIKDIAGELNVECILEDLPLNPWHQVMEEGAKIKASLNGPVQILCAGTSFYDQVCASDSVDIGYSYISRSFFGRLASLDVACPRCTTRQRRSGANGNVRQLVTGIVLSPVGRSKLRAAAA